MARSSILALIGATALAGFAAGAAQRPAALSQTNPGLWEIAGVPGARAPARECVGDIAALARFEHRGRSCSSKVLRDGESSAEIEYSCGGSGFGRSTLTVLTPRSLRIETQGISDNLPFHYVLQARRVGDCPGRSTASRH